MPGPKPGVRPRPMGGFNPGIGNSTEHLDEAAVKAASKQKQLNQKQSCVWMNLWRRHQHILMYM